MKKLKYIIPFVVLITAISSFSDTSKNFVRETAILDSIKKQDSLAIIATKKQDSIDNLKTKFFKGNAHASYYHDRFTGRRTASGQIFNNKKFTAAHRTLKFGTKVKVTSIVSKKSVIVTVNDRGPFVKGRDIDLSKAAFMKIAPSKYGGHIKVNLELVE